MILLGAKKLYKPPNLEVAILCNTSSIITLKSDIHIFCAGPGAILADLLCVFVYLRITISH